jgi:hypothetical protein
MNMNAPAPRKKIAIIGSGISGAAAAWSLNFTQDVTLFEAEDRAGGHTCTVDVDYDGTPISVDVGFIVFNERNYPNLCALFDHLDVKSEKTNMSFALSLNGGQREWCGINLGTVFSQKANMFSPSFLWMLREITRFNKQCLKDRDGGFLGTMTIGQYLNKRKFSKRFQDDYLIPMAAAIWSTPKVKMLAFPAMSFIQFFENHRLLELEPPTWRTVSGGSRNYHQKLLATLGDRVKLNTQITAYNKSGDGSVLLTDQNGKTERFDAVVFACHSDQALAILASGDGSEETKSVLADIKYKPNRVILHRDPTFMPKRKKAWAAWNYMRETEANGEESEICLTYWMNRLQNIDFEKPLFVTLNPTREPDPAKIFGEWTFDHPQYDQAAFDAQKRISFLQGNDNIFFAGAWAGFGFHEDGLRSGLEAAEALGGHVPWRSLEPEALPIVVAAE